MSGHEGDRDDRNEYCGGPTANYEGDHWEKDQDGDEHKASEARRT
jgi:hypothetical protein